MKRAGLDTSFINDCFDAGIKGNEVALRLQALGYTAYIGPYVFYELARIFLTNNPFKGQGLFIFLRELDPKFITRRDILYVMEFLKLTTGVSIPFEADSFLVSEYKLRAFHFAIGEYDFFSKFIITRQRSLAELKYIWAAALHQQAFKKMGFDDFNQMIVDVFRSIMNGEINKISYIKKIIMLATNQHILLTDKGVIRLISDINSYPCFSALIRSYIYINYLCDGFNNVPKQDRFTDSLVLIEYAHCDIVFSNDIRLVEKHSRCIAPWLKVLKGNDFIT